MDNQKLDYLVAYRHDIDYALADGFSLVLRKIRQRLSEMALSPGEQLQCDVVDDDELVILTIMGLDEVDADLISDDVTKPLKEWWWHLGKIRTKTYPIALLPVYLQAVYSET